MSMLQPRHCSHLPLEERCAVALLVAMSKRMSVLLGKKQKQDDLCSMQNLTYCLPSMQPFSPVVLGPRRTDTSATLTTSERVEDINSNFQGC